MVSAGIPVRYHADARYPIDLHMSSFIPYLKVNPVHFSETFHSKGEPDCSTDEMAALTATLDVLHRNAPVVFLALVFLSLCAYAAFSHVQNRRKLPLPPKPPGFPVLGNTIDFVQAAKKNKIHLLLQRWAEQYGEIMRVQVGPMTSYYLNSDQAVKVGAPLQCGHFSRGQDSAEFPHSP